MICLVLPHFTTDRRRSPPQAALQPLSGAPRAGHAAGARRRAGSPLRTARRAQLGEPAQPGARRRRGRGRLGPGRSSRTPARQRVGEPRRWRHEPSPAAGWKPQAAHQRVARFRRGAANPAGGPRVGVQHRAGRPRAARRGSHGRAAGRGWRRGPGGARLPGLRRLASGARARAARGMGGARLCSGAGRPASAARGAHSVRLPGGVALRRRHRGLQAVRARAAVSSGQARWRSAWEARSKAARSRARRSRVGPMRSMPRPMRSPREHRSRALRPKPSRVRSRRRGCTR